MKTIEELAAELGTTEDVIEGYTYHLMRAHGDAAVVASRTQERPTGIHEPGNPIVVTLTGPAVDAIHTAWRSGEPYAVIPSEDGNDA